MDHDDFPQDHEILALHQPVQGQSLLQSLESYWRELRGAQRLPVRSAVDPTRIDAVLPHAFIAERISQRSDRGRWARYAAVGAVRRRFTRYPC